MASCWEEGHAQHNPSPEKKFDPSSVKTIFGHESTEFNRKLLHKLIQALESLINVMF